MRRSPQQADGQLADARAKAELAKRELDRALTLVQTSAVSESIVDQRRQTLQAAHAAEMQAEGALKAAKLNVEFTHVMAPIAGRVSRHLVTAGNLVQGSEGGSTLLTSIVSLDPIYIYFDVDEATYLQEQPALVRRQAAEFARHAESGAGDADRRDQAVA